MKTAHFTKKCRNCGLSFSQKKSSQVFCSKKCRDAYYAVTYFGREEVEKICIYCGKTFTTTKPKRQVYCLPECRIASGNQRKENLLASRQAEHVTYLADRYDILKKANFRCSDCGRTAKDGASLDVEYRDGVLVAVCTDCRIGRKETSND